MNRSARRNSRDTTTVETERSRGVDCENWKLGWPAPVHLADDSFLCPARDRAGSHRKSKSHQFVQILIISVTLIVVAVPEGARCYTIVHAVLSLIIPLEFRLTTRRHPRLGICFVQSLCAIVILTSGHPQASTPVKNKCLYSDLAQDMVLIGITDIEDSLRTSERGETALASKPSSARGMRTCTTGLSYAARCQKR